MDNTERLKFLLIHCYIACDNKKMLLILCSGKKRWKGNPGDITTVHHILLVGQNPEREKLTHCLPRRFRKMVSAYCVSVSPPPPKGNHN